MNYGKEKKDREKNDETKIDEAGFHEAAEILRLYREIEGKNSHILNT